MIKEKYLLDANVFVTPYQNYYPFDFAPGFWNQLSPKLSLENVAVLDVVKDEIIKGDDELSDWFKDVPNLNILDRRDANIIKEYSKVLTYLQTSPSYSDKALRAWSQNGVADPWLIAAAKAYGYTIVTLEVSVGKITTVCNRPKIPSVGGDLGVKCENLFSFMRKMGFSL